MSRIDEYLGPVRQLSRNEFGERYPHPFLIVYIDEDKAIDEWSFRTTAMPAPAEDVAGLSPEAGRYRIFPLVKAVGNPWRERVSVGRARNNDIMLPDNSVSKLHAYFTVEDNGRWMVSDAGSRNGTRVAGERLPIGHAVPAKSGDTVTFGAINVTFLASGALYDFITEKTTAGAAGE